MVLCTIFMAQQVLDGCLLSQLAQNEPKESFVHYLYLASRNDLNPVMMKRLLTLSILLSTLTLMAQTVDITFQLNMSSVTTSPDGPFLAGGGNFGNPGDNPMTETGVGTDIYTITVTQPAGFSSFYTFTNGNCPDYSCKENIAGLPCANPDNFNDRFLPPVSQDTTILACFGQCTTDGECEALETSDLTFRVDMNDYEGNFTTVSIGGTWNNFNPIEFPMTETSLGSGIYETTLNFTDGLTYEFKFIEDGGQGGEEYYETLTEGSSCTVTAGPFTNRVFTVNGDEVFDTVCFESCESCENTVPIYNVLFKVDMNDYTGPAFSAVDLNGSFNNFCGGCAPMSDDDLDGVYELSVAIEEGTVEYLFTLDAFGTGQEVFQDGDPCTSTIDGFINRTLDVTGDIELEAVCYNSCNACGASSVDEFEQDLFTIFPNPSEGMIRVNTTAQLLPAVLVYDIRGAVVARPTLDLDNGFIDLSTLESGYYFVQLTTGTKTGISPIVIK